MPTLAEHAYHYQRSTSRGGCVFIAHSVVVRNVMRDSMAHSLTRGRFLDISELEGDIKRQTNNLWFL